MKLRANSSNTPERRSQILDAAAECFMLNGYEATTVDEIAALIGSTKGLIYYSYKSKAELFFAVYKQAMEFTIDGVAPIVNLELDSFEKMRTMCETHILLLMDTFAYHVVSKQGIETHLPRALTPAQRRVLRDLISLRDRYEKMFADVIEEGVNTAAIRAVNASLAAKTILGALNGISTWYRPREGETAAERQRVAAEVADIVVRGLSSRPNL